MAAPIVYRWDDANAPVARGERRSLCDILYACLVTGYGDKPGAGWTREFVNATFDKAVFRPGAGTRFFLRVDGNTTTYAYEHKIAAYEAMTDIDTGIGPFSPSYQYLTVVSTAANTTARPWILIADDRFFYFICWKNDTATPISFNNNSGMAFGDIVPRRADDAWCCCVGASNANMAVFGNIVGPSIASSGGQNVAAFPRAYNGVATPVFSQMIRGGGPHPDNGTPGGSGIAWAAGDAILLARPFLGDTTSPGMRGYLPGLYYPCHPLAFGNLEAISANGKNFLSIRAYGTAGPVNFFISTDDWRA